MSIIRTFLFIIGAAVAIAHSRGINGGACCKPCSDGHTRKYELFSREFVPVGSVTLKQLPVDFGWSNHFMLSVNAHSCYSIENLAFYASRQPIPGPLDADAFPFQYGELNASRVSKTFALQDDVDEKTCSDQLTFALRAAVNPTCTDDFRGSSVDRSLAWAVSTLIPVASHDWSSSLVDKLPYCCVAEGAAVERFRELGVMPDSEPSSFAIDSVGLRSVARPALVDADVASRPQLARSHLAPRQADSGDLDADGTTGEPIVASSTSSSSGGSACTPAEPVVELSATSATVSYTDPCVTRKRAVHNFELQMSSNGSPFTTQYQTSETVWTHTIDGLNPSTNYGFRVCDNGVCGPSFVGSTPSSGSTQIQGNSDTFGQTVAGLPLWLLIVICVAALLAVAAVVVTIVLLRRRAARRSKSASKTPVVVSDANTAAPSDAPVAVTVAADAEEEDSSVSSLEYLDRGEAGAIAEEKRRRAVSELLAEYKPHRVLRRKELKEESSYSSAWDSDDEEEWARLSKAATSIQAGWRGYRVRHPRTGALESSGDSVAHLLAAFDALAAQLHTAAPGSAEFARIYTEMFDQLEEMRRAARMMFGDEDDVPADIAAAINALADAARDLLNVRDGDQQGMESAEHRLLSERRRLAELLSGATGAAAQQPMRRARSWSAFRTLLRDYRLQKQELEQSGDESSEALHELLTRFRAQCDAILPRDEEDTEESEMSRDESMDSTDSRRSSSSWAQMKSLLQQYRAGRANEPVALALPVGRSEARVPRSGDRWKDREAILQRLEMHLDRATTEGASSESRPVLRKVRHVPKPIIKMMDITPAPASELDGAALPWKARDTGSHNVTFADPDSEDESAEHSASASSEASSSLAEASLDSQASTASTGSSSSRRGPGSPLMRVGPVMFQKRVLRPRGGASDLAGQIVARRRATGLASDRSSESSGDLSLSTSAGVVCDDSVPTVSRNSPRLLRRRAGKEQPLDASKEQPSPKAEALSETPTSSFVQAV